MQSFSSLDCDFDFCQHWSFSNCFCVTLYFFDILDILSGDGQEGVREKNTPMVYFVAKSDYQQKYEQVPDLLVKFVSMFSVF